MDIHHLCATMKEKVTLELQDAVDPGARGDILIAALYELSRSVLPALGCPKKSQEYFDGQGAVLDLISFIAIPLIRGAAHERRGVAVLSEIGEGCLDPLLKKKLHVYAQELLAKSSPELPKPTIGWGRWFPWLCAACAASVLALYLARPNPPAPATRPEGPKLAAVPEPVPRPSAPTHASAYAPSVGATAVDGAGIRDRSADDPRPAERPDALPPAPAQGEQITRVHIVNNQVLVPVTLKNGAESVKIELVLDTGATRTAIHDTLAGRLRIDLRQARVSQAEVADGRMIRSRIAKIDSLAVGPFAMASPELELIPYNGAEARHDGLLGMDFLGKHRYQIDMEHELIRWF